MTSGEINAGFVAGPDSMRKEDVMPATALQIVESYLGAIETRDFETARTYLADRPFAYCSPVMTSTSPDEFIHNVSHIGPILTSIERRHVFCDGNEVCHILRFVTSLSVITATDVVQWCTVRNGKIVRIETFFDARAYREMFVQDGDQLS